MKIRWNGGRVIRRIVAGYEWSRETGYEQDVVEDDIAAELLTDPSGLFVAVDKDAAEALFAMDEAGEMEETEEEVAGNSDALAIFDRAVSAGEILNEDAKDECDEGEDRQ